MINFTVMCVQPIEIEVDIFKKISKIKVNKKLYRESQIPWINNFKKFHDQSKHFNSILSEVEKNAGLLSDDLQSDCYKVYGKISLTDYLDKKSVGFDLNFDERLSTLTIVYEFSFNLEEEILNELFDDDNYDHEHRHNFYNTIRNLLVKEEDHSVIGSWAYQVRARCIRKINSIFGFQLNPEVQTQIRNNTGNISLLINGLPEKNSLNYREKIINSNQKAERVENNQNSLINNTQLEFVFHGRFHTIITENFDYYYRFFPILYHAQFMWSSVHSFTSSMDILNRKMLLGEFSNNNETQLIDGYINKFELVRIHNQDMKMYFESDSDTVFSRIESIWTIRESLSELNNYVSSFKEFIEKSYQRKIEKSNHRQNTILFIISCIQSLGLVSIWVDYLSLSKVESFVKTTGLIKETDNGLLLVINSWLPIIILLVIFLIVYNALFKK